jgi:galactoside O-acetyltransferase
VAWLERQELHDLGFASLGANVLISKRASLYNCANIHVGNNVRVDDFCVLSAGDGGIRIGSYVHIAVHCSIIGGGSVTLEDFSGLSSRVAVYSSNEDYSGRAMTNPTVPAEFTNVAFSAVYIGRHVIIGTGSVILPGAVIEEGAAVGALTLVAHRCEAFGVYAGSPARRVSTRSRDLLEMEQNLLGDTGNDT